MSISFVASPRHYTIEEFKETVKRLVFTSWKPAFPTLHNTGVPSLAQWMTLGATPQERWGANLNRYYAGMGWHAGPHLVICPDYIWILSELTAPGVSVSCWNSSTLGIEMVGNFEIGGDEFESGLGAKIRDNAAVAIAALAEKIGWGELGDFVLGVRGLHFHRECIRDHHSCPGTKVSKSDMLRQISTLRGTLESESRQIQKAQPTKPADGNKNPKDGGLSVEQIQVALNKLGSRPTLAVDGILGPATRAAIVNFQRENGLVEDWEPGTKTRTLLEKAVESTN